MINHETGRTLAAAHEAHIRRGILTDPAHCPTCLAAAIRAGTVRQDNGPKRAYRKPDRIGRRARRRGVRVNPTEAWTVTGQPGRRERVDQWRAGGVRRARKRKQ